MAQGTGGPTTQSPAPARPVRMSRRRRWTVALIVAGLAVLTAVLVALALIPVPHSYSFDLGSSFGGNMPTNFANDLTDSLCPAGAHAALSLTSQGLNITWAIFSPNGSSLWGQHVANANVSFVLPACGWYFFYAAGVGIGAYHIHGTVSYSAPVL